MPAISSSADVNIPAIYTQLLNPSQIEALRNTLYESYMDALQFFREASVTISEREALQLYLQQHQKAMPAFYLSAANSTERFNLA